MALREKQIQQSYRPVIAVHKWFARRPGSLFRGLLLAEFSSRPLEESFFQGHSFQGIRIADPFMGGGTPLLEANRVGCNVVGFDINPMAHWIVGREIEWLDLDAYRDASNRLLAKLEADLGRLYCTQCRHCGCERAPVKYFLWVKTMACKECHSNIDLFPGYLLSENRRHPRNVFICPDCGNLTEVLDRDDPGPCGTCDRPLVLEGPAKNKRCPCRACGCVNDYPDSRNGPPRHRLFAIEYHCSKCKQGGHQGRFFKMPDADDLARLEEVREIRAATRPRFVPDDPIPPGDETTRLHRWGYRLYREMFNERQLLCLEASARLVAAEKEQQRPTGLGDEFLRLAAVSEHALPL